MVKKTIILSLGGSIIIPDEIDVAYLKKLRRLLVGFARSGFRFIVVTGGGNVCRKYQKAARRITPAITADDLDWVGIASTKLNAEFIRTLLGSHAYHEVLSNPTKRVVTDKRILVGAGWKPGFSSDKDAVMLAHTYGAETVVNLSNIPFVYSADPRKVKSARPIKQMSWNQLLDLTGRTWKPGAHVPFDPEASKLAQQLGIRVIVCLGTDIANLKKILTGKKFQGTVIE